MDTYEHVMTTLGEEGNEVAVRVSKVLRFGTDDIEPGQELTAIERLENEIHDFLGALVEVVDRVYINAPTDEAKILAKRVKMLKMLSYARSQGTVIDFDDGSLIDRPCRRDD